jgi:2-C-methyl-D-erythritol 2,4-cyclodiphosphate synthase
MKYRVGIGFDSHRFVAGRKLLLGGVEIPHDRGLEGHSDADVLLHALTDALLGAAGLGDIGSHFPDSDPKWKNASSRTFVEGAVRMFREKSYRIANVDLIVLAEAPKLQSHRSEICRSIAAMLQIPEACVNLKATTTDRMGFIGRDEGIAAQAIALLEIDQ